MAMWMAVSGAFATDPKQATISVIIDYGDGAELHLPALKWRRDLTVLGALQATSKHPHGVEFRSRGSGAYTLVTQIGDLKNEGAEDRGRNWIYRVNGKKADVGVGAYELRPADTILWRFERHDYNRR